MKSRLICFKALLIYRPLESHFTQKLITSIQSHVASAGSCSRTLAMNLRKVLSYSLALGYENRVMPNTVAPLLCDFLGLLEIGHALFAKRASISVGTKKLTDPEVGLLPNKI